MPDLSQTQPFAFVCEGGLVKSKSTFIMHPGQALELLNFEPDIKGGYRRRDGFKAYVNQIGNFDYVNNISQIIVKLIENDAQGVYNVGTEMKSMYIMAVKTKEDVRPVNRKIHDTMPSDVSMNIDKLNIFLKDKD